MSEAEALATAHWRATLSTALQVNDAWSLSGWLHEASGSCLLVRGLHAAIGELCELHDCSDGRCSPIGHAEVVGLRAEVLELACLESHASLSRRVRVSATGERLRVPVGEPVLGRVLDGYGRPIDAGPALTSATRVPIDAPPPRVLSRRPIGAVLPTGVRAIDALLTCGRGQRLLIQAPAGVGKSSLLTRLAQGCGADVVVVALVGERGREVAEFASRLLRHGGPARSVVVAAAADRPAIERVKCALSATAIAESFRAQGRHVLLLVDSLTRWVRARCEAGIGRDGMHGNVLPQSVTGDGGQGEALARLLERAGNDANGSISAFYTVLCDESAATDPIAEQARAVADGHIQLSRALANRGQYPAIDVLRSVSRLAPRLCSRRHLRNALQLRAMLARLEDLDLLLKVGEYEPGADALADRAIRLRPHIDAFLAEVPQPDDVRNTATTVSPQRIVSAGPVGFAGIERALDDLLAAEEASAAADVPGDPSRAALQ